MKIKFLSFFVGIFAVSLLATSCLDSDSEEIVYGSETSITAFSIGTVNIQKIGKDQSGKDSTYIDSLNCSNYPFTIDQLNRTIENKDSLPVGCDISKVLTKITSDTQLITYVKPSTSQDTLWTNTDSIDFSKGAVTFKVYNYNGLMGKPYKVKVNVHQQDPDTLVWARIEKTFAGGNLTRQKALYTAGRLYVFGQQDGKAVAQYATITSGHLSDWSSIALPAGTDSYSATVWQGYIYFLADGQLQRLGTDTPTIEAVASAPQLKQLIAAFDGGTQGSTSTLYARNEAGEFVSLKGEKWSTDGTTPATFPEDERFSTVSIPVSYNAQLVRTILMSHNPTEQDSTSLVYLRTEGADDGWGLKVQNNPATCPNLENITMVYYDKKLYAFGGRATFGTKTVEPFQSFYVSTDNGLTWAAVTRYLFFPKDNSFAQAYENGHQNYSATVDTMEQNNFIWIIWEDGSVSRGRINRFGFAPKW